MLANSWQFLRQRQMKILKLENRHLGEMPIMKEFCKGAGARLFSIKATKSKRLCLLLERRHYTNVRGCTVLLTSLHVDIFELKVYRPAWELCKGYFNVDTYLIAPWLKDIQLVLFMSQKLIYL